MAMARWNQQEFGAWQDKTMQEISSICVYCGSSNDALASHMDLADRFGKALAERRIRLVFGAGNVGLMGAAARAARDAGGQVLGIIPHFISTFEPPCEDIELRVVDTMHTRKMMMAEESEAFVALPGGIGTLDEVVEMLSWQRLELHNKPVVLLDEDGFWDPLFHLFEHFVQANLLPRSFAAGVKRAKTVDEALAMILTGTASPQKETPAA
jgi:uncharacterized protein (TIGR00730 family)